MHQTNNNNQHDSYYDNYNDQMVNSPRKSQQRQKVTFRLGEPKRVTLGYMPGKMIASRYGADQVMYSLDNDQVMFVDQEAADQIDKTGANTGDTIELVKERRGTGPGNQTGWDIRLVGRSGIGNHQSAPQAERTPPQAERIPPQRANHPIDSQTAARRREQATSDAAYAENIGTLERQQQEELPDWINYEDCKPAQLTPASPSSRDMMLKCLCHAIDAASAATRYAQELKLQITFGGEDVRAIALTEYIGLQKVGRA